MDYERIANLLDQKLDEWLASDKSQTPIEFLGITEKEYRRWKRDPRRVPMSWRNK